MRQPMAEARAQVYPRVCGGTAMQNALVFGFEGLSPRVRGNRGERGCVGGEKRSIPACAGEPDRRVWPLWYAKGLSPRVRGNRATPRRRTGALRSIPACAGEPMMPVRLPS